MAPGMKGNGGEGRGMEGDFNGQFFLTVKVQV